MIAKQQVIILNQIPLISSLITLKSQEAEGETEHNIF